MSTLSERIKLYIEYKGISQAEFGKSLGRSEGWVNNAGKTLKFEQIKTIRSNYPDLNVDWLVNNVGDMINTKDAAKDIIFDKKSFGLGVYLRDNHERLMKEDPTYALFMDKIGAEIAIEKILKSSKQNQ